MTEVVRSTALVSPDAVAVIAVNWNQWRLSLECLASLKRTVGAEWHLFLVDNASSDGSRDHLIDLGPSVTVIHSGVNGGWTGGNNLGIRFAMEAGYVRFFILNNDAQVTSNTIAKLLEVAKGDPLPVVGPIQLDETGQTLEFIGAAIDPNTGLPEFMPVEGVNRASLPAFYPTTFVRGAGLLVTSEHIDRIGPFDDRFYLFFDETDWCFKARKLGYPVMMTSQAEIIHKRSASVGGVHSPLIIYFHTRNSMLFAERNCTARQRLRQAVELARWSSRLTPEIKTRRRVGALLFGKSKPAIAFRRGVRDYLLRRFGDCPPFIRTISGLR